MCRFAVGGASARGFAEQQSAAEGGGELPISHSDIEIKTADAFLSIGRFAYRLPTSGIDERR